MAMNKKSGPFRRHAVARLAAMPLVLIGSTRARAAEFVWKYATSQDPTCSVNLRAAEAITRIREATGGRVEINLFPANQLGSDTDLISQARNGGIQILNISSVIMTPMHDSANSEALAAFHPMNRVGTVNDIARAVLYLEDAVFSTGEIVHVDGGLIAGR